MLEIENDELKMELEKAVAKAKELQQQLEDVEETVFTCMNNILSNNQQSLSSEEAKCQEVSGTIAEKTVLVTNQKQNIVWEGYGLRLHIPPNSLPEDCSQFELKMAVSRLGQVQVTNR